MQPHAANFTSPYGRSLEPSVDKCVQRKPSRPASSLGDDPKTLSGSERADRRKPATAPAPTSAQHPPTSAAWTLRARTPPPRRGSRPGAPPPAGPTSGLAVAPSSRGRAPSADSTPAAQTL